MSRENPKTMTGVLKHFLPDGWFQVHPSPCSDTGDLQLLQSLQQALVIPRASGWGHPPGRNVLSCSDLIIKRVTAAECWCRSLPRGPGNCFPGFSSLISTDVWLHFGLKISTVNSTTNKWSLKTGTRKAWWCLHFIPAFKRQKQANLWVEAQSGLQSEFQDC